MSAVTSTRARWNIGPWTDSLTYHWSWVFCLIPLLMMGPLYPTDYLWIFLMVKGLNFAHQAIAIPICYLDGDVFSRDRRRLLVLPLLLLAGALIAGVFWETRWRPRTLSPAMLAAAVARLWSMGRRLLLPRGDCLFLAGFSDCWRWGPDYFCRRCLGGFPSSMDRRTLSFC